MGFTLHEKEDFPGKKKKCFWVGKPIQHFNFQMADHVNVHSHSLWRKQIILTFGIEQWTAKHNSRSELLMSSKSNKVFKDDIKREKKKQTNIDLGKNATYRLYKIQLHIALMTGIYFAFEFFFILTNLYTLWDNINTKQQQVKNESYKFHLPERTNH